MSKRINITATTLNAKKFMGELSEIRMKLSPTQGNTGKKIQNYSDRSRKICLDERKEREANKKQKEKIYLIRGKCRYNCG